MFLQSQRTLQSKRIAKFFSFYKPYRALFTADMVASLIVTVVALVLPLCIRRITQDVLAAAQPGPELYSQILQNGALMLGLIVVQTAAGLFYDGMGHAMGAKM